MSRFVQKAVDSLFSTISTGLDAQLDTVEAAESIANGSLTRPVDFYKGAVPDDNRSPIIQVYHTGFNFQEPGGQRNDFMTVFCSVVFSYLSPDADLEATELFINRYLTGLIETIITDPTLGGNVAGAYITDGDSGVSEGDQSMSRFVEAINVDVHVHTV